MKRGLRAVVVYGVYRFSSPYDSAPAELLKICRSWATARKWCAKGHNYIIRYKEFVCADGSRYRQPNKYYFGYDKDC